MTAFTNYLKVWSIFLLFIFGITGNKGFAEYSSDNNNGHSSQGRDYYFEKPSDDVIRILTYNIRNCIGMDGKTDFDRVAEVINRINPHVVALQEVDSVTHRMNGVDVLGILAKKTNMFPSYGPAIDFQGGKYGNGVLSREKPLSFEFIPLPGRQERRSLLMVEFEDYIIYCTHLNNAFPGDRHGSVLIIDYETRNSKKPIFLAGDINDTPGSRTLELLSENWIQLSGNEYTFRSDAPENVSTIFSG
jgi:endonuclease/exonuclease/phosphatase family metal-dependent hydrolase